MTGATYPKRYMHGYAVVPDGTGNWESSWGTCAMMGQRRARPAGRADGVGVDEISGLPSAWPLLVVIAVYASLAVEAVAQDGVATDRAALVALYDATGGETWTNSTNWKTDAPLGEW